LKEIITHVYYFPLPFLWLLIYFILFIKKEGYFLYVKLLTLVFYISLTPIFSFLLEYPLINIKNKYNSNIKYEAVLVPTAGIYKDYNNKWYPSYNSILRVSQGEKLAKKLNIPLIVSGGHLFINSVSEAEIVKNIINYDNLILEKSGKNSYETSVNLIKIFETHNLDIKMPLLLVTSPQHSLRMYLSLRTQGFNVKNYSLSERFKFDYKVFLPDIATIGKNNISLYEYTGILFYLFKRHIRI